MKKLLATVILLAVTGAWLAGNRSPVSCAAESPIGAKCPFDIFDAIWTGQTKIINAKTWYVMKCPQGHESLSESPR